jgi:hypothetical protein
MKIWKKLVWIWFYVIFKIYDDELRNKGGEFIRREEDRKGGSGKLGLDRREVYGF